MLGHYILDERNRPKLELDLVTWAMWFELDERRVLRQQRWTREDGTSILVSTVFLGVDHNFALTGPPVLWETMAFIEHEPGEEGQMRYTSMAEAIIGHNWLVEHLGGQVLE